MAIEYFIYDGRWYLLEPDRASVYTACGDDPKEVVRDIRHWADSDGWLVQWEDGKEKMVGLVSELSKESNVALLKLLEV